MNSKTNKKSEFDGVLKAIFEISKLGVSLIALIAVCIFIPNKISVVLTLSFFVYYLYVTIESRACVTLKKYYQRGRLNDT